MHALRAALILASFFPAVVSAQASEDPEAEALELFEESVTAYQEGRFDDATSLLTRAYSLHPEPVLLYNLARAQDGAGEFADAIASYQRYLDEAGDIPDRGAIEQRIATLRENVDERARLGRLDDVSDTPPDRRVEPDAPSDEGSGPSVLPFVVGGVGLATIGVGAVLGALALGAHDEAVGAPSQAETKSAQDRAEGLALASTITLIIGATLTAVGATWAIIELASGDDADDASAGLILGPDGASLVGRF